MIFFVFLSLAGLAWMLGQSVVAVLFIATAIIFSDVILAYLEGDTATKRFMKKWRWVGLGVALYVTGWAWTGIHFSSAGIHIVMLVCTLVLGYGLIGEPAKKGLVFMTVGILAVALVVMIHQVKGVPGGNFVEANYKSLIKADESFAGPLEIAEVKVGAVIYPDDNSQPNSGDDVLEKVLVAEKVRLTSREYKIDGVPLKQVQRLNPNSGTYIGGKLYWVQPSDYVAEAPLPRTQEAAATPTSSPAPASTPATAKKGESVKVSFKAGETVNTGILAGSGDVVRYSRVSAPFKILGPENMFTIVDDTAVDMHDPGKLIIIGGDQAGSVFVKVSDN